MAIAQMQHLKGGTCSGHVMIEHNRTSGGQSVCERIKYSLLFFSLFSSFSLAILQQKMDKHGKHDMDSRNGDWRNAVNT